MHQLIIFAAVVALFLVGGCVISYKNMKDYWKDHKHKADFILPLEKLQSLYAVAPEKYELKKGNTVYIQNYKTIHIGFSFRDYLKYLKWIEEVKENKEHLAALRCKSQFLEYARQDIETYKNSAQRELDEKQEEIRRMANSARIPISSIVDYPWDGEP